MAVYKTALQRFIANLLSEKSRLFCERALLIRIAHLNVMKYFICAAVIPISSFYWRPQKRVEHFDAPFLEYVKSTLHIVYRRCDSIIYKEKLR